MIWFGHFSLVRTRRWNIGLRPHRATCYERGGALLASLRTLHRTLLAREPLEGRRDGTAKPSASPTCLTCLALHAGLLALLLV